MTVSTLRQQLAKITDSDIDKDGDFIDWSYEGGRLKLSKQEVDDIEAICQEIAREARLDEIKRLSDYYIQHDGEGEHKPAKRCWK